jgi:hypothetical protein
LKAAPDLLEELARQDIQVWSEGGNLRCSAPSHLMTPELRADLAAHKLELLSFLDQAPPQIDRELDSCVA